MSNINSIVYKAAATVKNGGVIIFPTDTAFGIGCRLDSKSAVDRLFQVRNRPINQATPVLVSSLEMALAYYLDPCELTVKLMKKYWPGALTIVAKCQPDLIYHPVRGGDNTIGLRMPNHSVILDIINLVQVPILGPSANIHNQATPYKLADLDPNLTKLVDFVVPGKCSVGQASTVVEVVDNKLKVIRQGTIVLKNI
jgi:L-threonylcarbamoyladenylate synthase